MNSHGLYNVTLESTSAFRHPPKVGLVRERTGVPVFLLYLTQISRPGRFEVHSLEDVENQILTSTEPADKIAWRYLLPFFRGEGTLAHVVTLPILRESPLLPALCGEDRGLGHRSGIHVLKEYVEVADLVSIPQASRLLDVAQLRIFYEKLDSVLAPLQHYFSLLDLPLHFSSVDAAHFLRGLILPDSAAYYPWLHLPEGVSPPSAAVAAAYQRSDAEYNINEIPANRPLKGAVRPLFVHPPTELHDLISNRVNVVHAFNENDIRLWGGRTLADPLDADGRFISNRRTLKAVREAIHQICEPFVLEPMHSDLPRFVDVTIQSALMPLAKLFDTGHPRPFEVRVSLARTGRDDVLQVDLKFSIPYAVDQMSISLGLTG